MDERLLLADLHPVPIDRGWAWVIAISSFFMFLLIGGSFKAYGVLYAELVSYSPQDAHTIIGLHAMVLTMPLFSFVGVLLGDRFGCRVALIIGSLATSIGYISSAFVATSIPSLMYITYCLIAGTGRTIIYMCVITVLTQYFTKHLPFAIGLCQSGTSAGFFVWPYLFRVLFDSYGIKGTVALCGALSLNACCFAALIRPVSFYANGGRSFFANYGCSKSSNSSIGALNGDLRLEMPTSISSGGNLTGNIQNDKIARARDIEGSFFWNDFKQVVADNWSKVKTIVNNPIIVAYILSRISMAASVYPSLVIIPAYALEIELSEYDIATIMTVFGAADFVGRIAVGALANISYFDGRRTVIYAILAIIFGVSAVLATVHASLGHLVVHATITGFTGMTALCLLPVMIRDAFGVELFSRFYTFSISFTAPFIVISVYICQALQTLTGSWVWPIRYTGIFGLAAVVPLFAEFTVNRKITNGNTGNSKSSRK